MSKKLEKLERLEHARTRIRKAGLRATSARMAVLDFLTAHHGPVTHLEANERLEDQGYDKSTIFRALQHLSHAGLVRRMELGDHVWRFEVLPDSPDSKDFGQAHPHLLCVNCGTVTCLSDKDVKVNVSKSIGSVEEVLLRGHCSICSETG